MNAYPDLPEHLVRSLLIAVPNLRRRDVVDGGDRRNSGVSSKPRRGRLGALLHTHQRCAKSLGCRVVSDTHDRARANRTIVAESHLDSRFYELLDRSLMLAESCIDKTHVSENLGGVGDALRGGT